MPEQRPGRVGQLVNLEGLSPSRSLHQESKSPSIGHDKCPTMKTAADEEQRRAVSGGNHKKKICGWPMEKESRFQFQH